MAYPIANSAFLPSTADAPFLPPKLNEMPVFNPGSRFYQCEDGSTRWMTQEEAINRGGCKVVEGSQMNPNRFPVLNMGQASPSAPGSQGTPTPASPAQPALSFDSQFVWPGYPIVSPLNYPAPPPGTNCAWEEDVDGNDIYVCRPEKGAARGPVLYAAGPVSFPAQTFFTGFY